MSEKRKDRIDSIKIYEKDEDEDPQTVEVVPLKRTDKVNKYGQSLPSSVHNYCLFCPENKKGFQKITHHWYDCHSDEKEVKDILAIGREKKEIGQFGDWRSGLMLHKNSFIEK